MDNYPNIEPFRISELLSMEELGLCWVVNDEGAISYQPIFYGYVKKIQERTVKKIDKL
jgi:hypothetical protein